MRSRLQPEKRDAARAANPCLNNNELISNVHPEMTVFGPGQGRSDFASAGEAMATLRIAKERERRPGQKDSAYVYFLN